MRGFLSNRGFQEMELEGTRELVMGRRVGEFISLRVYTSISRGSARDRGKDAIRVELYWMDRANGNEIIHIGHSRKVLRIQTWRRNLAKRINNWQSLIGPDCPSCGAKMRLVSGRYGDFWGCGRYHTTGCGHTIDES